MDMDINRIPVVCSAHAEVIPPRHPPASFRPRLLRTRGGDPKTMKIRKYS